MVSSSFYVNIGGNTQGPLTKEQLVNLARTNQLAPTDFVGFDKDGAKRWVSASEVRGLFPTQLATPLLIFVSTIVCSLIAALVGWFFEWRWTLLLSLGLLSAILALPAFDQTSEGRKRRPLYIAFSSFVGFLLLYSAFIADPWGSVPASSLDKAAAVIMGGWSKNGGLFSHPSESWHGSAFVYEKDGDVLRLVTNSHCIGLASIAKAAGVIEKYGLSILFPSGKRCEVMRVAELTKQGVDIAMVEVRADGLVSGRDYVIIPVKKLSRLNLAVGDEVIAVGAPLNPGFARTETFGRVSAFRTAAEFGGNASWIQHDAAITNGNSGGPLFVRRGKKAYLIGVNTWALKGFSTYSFAISVDSFIDQNAIWDDATPTGAASLIGKLYDQPAAQQQPATVNPTPTKISPFKPYNEYVSLAIWGALMAYQLIIAPFMSKEKQSSA